MRNLMMNTVAALATTALLATPVLAEGVVHELTVNTEYSTLTDSNAKDFYPTIADDLLTAIADQLPMTDDTHGYVVTVNIQSMSLDGETMLPDSREFNTLEGVVSISSPETNSGVESYPIKLRAISPDAVVPEGYYSVEPSDGDFYRALVSAFADQVVDVVPENMDTAVAK